MMNINLQLLHIRRALAVHETGVTANQNVLARNVPTVSLFWPAISW